MKLHKSFSLFSHLETTVYVRIINLFNTKNTLNVYEETGSPADDGFITNLERYGWIADYYSPEYIDIYKAINIKNGQSYWDVLGKELYGHPRQIMFGINIKY